MNAGDIDALLMRMAQESDSDKLDYLKKQAGKIGRSGIRSSCEALISNSAKMREAALLAIEGIADSSGMMDMEGILLQALKPTIDTLHDDSPEVRKAGVRILRQMVHQYYVNTRHLDMLNPGLRKLVVEIVHPLVSKLDDENETIEVRLAIADVLYRYCGQENVDGFVWGNSSYYDMARSVFIAGLDDESAEVRNFAAEIFQYDKDKDLSKKAEGILTGKSVVDPLIQALEDEDENVVMRAAFALGRMGDKRAVESLIQALGNDRDHYGRAGAANLLGEIRDKRAIEPLIQALEDEDEEVRFNATLALGKMGEQRVVEPLIQALKDKNKYTRWKATNAIGKTGDKRVIEPLIQALNDEFEDVRMGTARALGEIWDERVVEPLIQALKDKESCVRWEAATALGEIKDLRALEPLTQALNDEHEDVRNNAKDALEKIRSHDS